MMIISNRDYELSPSSVLGLLSNHFFREMHELPPPQQLFIISISMFSNTMITTITSTTTIIIIIIIIIDTFVTIFLPSFSTNSYVIIDTTPTLIVSSLVDECHCMGLIIYQHLSDSSLLGLLSNHFFRATHDLPPPQQWFIVVFPWWGLSWSS